MLCVFLVIVSVLVYNFFGRIFNVAITRIIRTLRIDNRAFNQENSDKPDGGFFSRYFKRDG